MIRPNLSIGRIVLTVWLVFSILYIGYYEVIQFRAFRQAAYNSGRTDAVSQVIAEAQKCQPFPVNVGGAQVTLVSVECLQQAAKQGEGQAPAQQK
jgi:hypothetical protein